MRKSALKYFVCPETGKALRLIVHHQEGDHVMEGELINIEDENRRYPIHHGVPRFANLEELQTEQKDTIDTFSFKWSQVPEYAFNRASKAVRENWYYERFGFDKGDASFQEFLSGAQIVLEAGTGTGVDTDLLTRNFSGLLFGIDISTAIDTAFERFGNNERVVLAQADIQHLPFKPNTFDLISCDQVLHHTPNPPENFKKLVNLLNAGGGLMLYVYSVKGPLREFADDHLRAIYTQSSLDDAVDFSERITRLGRNLSQINATVIIDDDMPELGIQKGSYDVQRLIYDHIIKCFWRDDYDFKTNAMVNFDWYRPLHAFRYTEEEVRQWAESEHLKIEHLQVSPSGISSIMRKPQ